MGHKTFIVNFSFLESPGYGFLLANFSTYRIQSLDNELLDAVIFIAKMGDGSKMALASYP
jgi:hypothetical protein